MANSRAVTDAIPSTELEVAGPYNGHTGNFDKTRGPIDKIIIHTMAGTWEGAAARFDDPTSNVSAHYGIKETGELIHWLEEYWTAYHSGDYLINQTSIGIEHEDLGNYNDPRPDALYLTSAKLVADICRFYGIPCDREHIKKHSEVSDAPTACPDALNIDRIVKMASDLLNPVVSVQPEITDQTMLPFGGDIGTIEFQAARSLVNDLKRDNGVFTTNIKAIEANVTTLASENANLKTDLAEAQQKLLDAQNTPNPTPTTQSLAQYTAGDLLKELFNRLRPN